MVSLLDLWLAIVLWAVAVFMASSLLHMVLTYHRSDYKQLPNEAAISEVMRQQPPAPGAYMSPWLPSHKEMETPAAKEKFQRGPVFHMTVMPSGLPNMGKYLGMWFGFCLVMSVFVAYLASRTLAPGTEYLQVFRVAGTAAFLGYGASYLSDMIWKSQPVSNTMKAVFDGLIYALLTAGIFGWLWPR